ncbi:hypothetical protein AKO1_006670 [Acrasis kona]|uniref:RWP-RK domain-containing protein n=1 Tax=Acrasis kona TaxID=1008807 RepID=A0AAW2ZLF0_9EUKA
MEEAPTQVVIQQKKGAKRHYAVTNINNYTFEDIAKYFNFPISHAAVSLRVSQTYLKRLCRHLNITRWPYRKLSCIQKKIETKSMVSRGGKHSKAAVVEISKLKKQVADIFSGESSATDEDDLGHSQEEEEDDSPNSGEGLVQKNIFELQDTLQTNEYSTFESYQETIIHRPIEQENLYFKSRNCSNENDATPLGLTLDVEWISSFLCQQATQCT